MTSLYEKDFHAWSLEQANYLRLGNIDRLDMENLIEEIETLSAPDKRALKSFIKKLLSHLLKKKYQPNKYTSSWEHTIKNCRNEIDDILNENPSFKRFLPEYFSVSYKRAREEAAFETGLELNTFPEKCPWNIKDVLEIR